MAKLIFLASYPESGNTWMRLMLSSLIYPQQELNINNIKGSSSAADRLLFEKHTGLDASELSSEVLSRMRSAWYESLLLSNEEMIILKTHDAFRNQSDDPLFATSLDVKVIYLVRNPLDIVISYSHHSQESVSLTIDKLNDPSRKLSDWSKPQLPQFLGNWSHHVTSWTQSEADLLLVRYEDLRNDIMHVMSKVTAFLKLDADIHAVERVVDETSLDKLRQQEVKHGFNERLHSQSTFFGPGKIGQWKSKLTDTEVGSVIRIHESVMSEIGYL